MKNSNIVQKTAEIGPLEKCKTEVLNVLIGMSNHKQYGYSTHQYAKN